MGEFSFRCAKSKTSIPIPGRTPRPEEHCLVTLYLPQGQVVSGELTNYGEIVVNNAYTRGANGEECPIAGDILDHPWLANAGGELLNIYGAAGLQVLEGAVDTDDVFKRMLRSDEEGDAVEAATKLVRASQYDPTDRYETLPPSERCPWQGRDFPSPREFVEHVYQGNATQAYHDLYDHEVAVRFYQTFPSEAPSKNAIQQTHENAMDATLDHIMIMLHPEDAERLMNREISLSELANDEEFLATETTMEHGLEADDLLPEHTINFEHADLALMMAMEDPVRRERLSAYALSDEQPEGPRLG